MKKYIKPVTEELILDVQPMMQAGSLDPTNGTATVFDDFVGEGTAAESRGSSIWDDED